MEGVARNSRADCKRPALRSWRYPRRSEGGPEDIWGDFGCHCRGEEAQWLLFEVGDGLSWWFGAFQMLNCDWRTNLGASRDNQPDASTWASRKGIFIERNDYMNLFYFALRDSDFFRAWMIYLDFGREMKWGSAAKNVLTSVGHWKIKKWPVWWPDIIGKTSFSFVNSVSWTRASIGKPGRCASFLIPLHRDYSGLCINWKESLCIETRISRPTWPLLQISWP